MSDQHCACGHAERVHEIGCLHECGCNEFRLCGCNGVDPVEEVTK